MKNEVTFSVHTNFNGETYDYYLEIRQGLNCISIYFSESDSDLIGDLIKTLNKTKLHMMQNKWKGNVPYGPVTG